MVMTPELLQLVLSIAETFDQRAGGVCPEDCLSTHYSTQLSYARYVSRPPIGASKLKIPQRINDMNVTNGELEAQIRSVLRTTFDLTK